MDYFLRSEMVLGEESFYKLQKASVILFGVGGVGSWCAEALIRTGLQHLAIVDFDTVASSNINRQLQALPQNIGEPKVYELQKRLNHINPSAQIQTLFERFTPESAEWFDLKNYDVVIDAIDFVDDKVFLIQTCMEQNIPIFCSMGAALKIESHHIKSSSIWNTFGCPLAKKVRDSLREKKVKGEALCVFSPEKRKNLKETPIIKGTKRANGSLVHITGQFGFRLAGHVIEYIASKEQEEKKDKEEYFSK